MTAANHQPLARKYRPQTFSELVGQDSTATALANAIKLGRTPQAVIFSGVRGVGKTTTARLYAKALNCDNGPTPTPCGTCVSCQAITTGNHEDVLEIDGASNTSVDDIRQLRDSIGYVPQRSKYKVYLIDEVHMLSQSAFNALLKTLEEPPGHVVFLFATTELQKIPQTILSRCQVFVLQKMPLATLVGRLEQILALENVPHEAGAMRTIAREARGSMRDALTILDQAIAISGGNLTRTICESITAQAPREQVLSLLRSVVGKDGATVIKLVDQIEKTGTDLQSVVEDMAQLCRHAFVIRDLGTASMELGQLDLDPAEVEELAGIGQLASPLELNQIFRVMIQCRKDMDGSPLDRYILENCALEWCLHGGLSKNTPQTKPAPTNQAIPKTIENPVAAVVPATPEKIEPVPTPATKSNTDSKKEFPGTWEGLVAAWKQHRPLQASKLEDVHLHQYGAELISLSVKETSFARCLLNKEEQTKLQQAFKELFDFQGKILIERESTTKSQSAPESLAEKNERATKERNDAKMNSAVNHQTTKDILDIFNGKVADVRIKDVE